MGAIINININRGGVTSESTIRPRFFFYNLFTHSTCVLPAQRIHRHDSKSLTTATAGRPRTQKNNANNIYPP